MALTQKDIAEHLGLSREAVKFALNGNGTLSAPTRERILQQAQEMGYDRHSNGAARSLAARRNGTKARSGVLALLIPDTPTLLHKSAYFAPLLDGIEVEAQARHLEICWLTLHHFGPLPRLLMNGSVDGVIAVQGDEMLAPSLAEHDVPLVWLSMQNEGGACILPDDRKGALLATRHLVELGHRRIGYIGFEPVFDGAAQRIAGFKESLQKAGCFDQKLLEYSVLEGGIDAVRSLMERAPDTTAIFCYNDFLAVDVVRELQRMGKNVPRDVSVVGFDDTAHEPNFAPALTSIRYDRQQMGRRAVSLLLDEVADAKQRKLEVFPVELVVRASTQKYA